MSLADPKILRAFGTSNQQLRRYFTATGRTADDADEETKACAKREHGAALKFTDWVRTIIQDGRYRAFKEYTFYVAADLARDGPPISPETVPLRAYAQGRVQLVDCEREIKDLSPSLRDKFLTKTEVPTDPAQPLGPKTPSYEANLLKLEEVCISICRAYTDRRVDAQCNLYNNLLPLFKYEPRDTSAVGRLRGEALSAYCDIMAEGYGYTHKQRQAIRGMMYYSQCLMFPASAWDYETRPVPADDGYQGDDVEVRNYLDAKGNGATMRLRSEITKEGLDMLIVHPARTIYDRSAPLATINTDTGCRFVGYWDIKRFGDIRGNPAYFNTDNIPINATGGSIYLQNLSFFSLIFPGQAINFPNGPVNQARGGMLSGGTTTDAATGVASNIVDVAASNELKANQGLYTTAATECSIYVTDLRVRVVPRDHGMGDYPRPVWLRMLVASDNTVIFAEWLPSLPAVYWGHNADDAKVLNLSQCHEIMWAQDTLTNIMSNLLMTMKRMLAQIIVVNKDCFGNTESGRAAYENFKTSLYGDNFYQQPHLLEISGLVQSRLEEGGMGKLKEAIISIVQPVAADANYMTNAFRAVSLVLSLLERLLALSPQEQGQPANHEITAEEVSAINKTTEGKFSAISESIDEARAAWKRLIDEASQAHGSNTVELAVVNEFTDDTIAAAGFEKLPDGGALAKEGMTITGTRQAMVHDYTYSSRDGANRQTDAQRAQLLIAITQALIPLIGKEGLGKKRLFELANIAFRSVGVGTDFKLEMKDGESDDVRDPNEQQAEQQQQQDAQAMQQAIAQLQQAQQAALGQGAATQKAILMLTQTIAKLAGIPTGQAGGGPIMQGQTAPGVPAEPGATPEPAMGDPLAQGQGEDVFAAPAHAPPP